MLGTQRNGLISAGLELGPREGQKASDGGAVLSWITGKNGAVGLSQHPSVVGYRRQR